MRYCIRDCRTLFSTGLDGSKQAPSHTLKSTIIDRIWAIVATLWDCSIGFLLAALVFVPLNWAMVRPLVGSFSCLVLDWCQALLEG